MDILGSERSGAWLAGTHLQDVPSRVALLLDFPMRTQDDVKGY